MQKGKFYKIVFFVPVVVLVAFLMGNTCVADTNLSHDENRLGLVLIDTLKELGPLERMPVVFPHDRHTEVLAKTGSDCTKCHMVDGDQISFKFKRISNLLEIDRDYLMGIYHDNCIDCHTTLNDSELSSSENILRPITCGGCHNKKGIQTVLFPMQKEVEFNKHLHFTHLKANEEKCEVCHHEYDEKVNKLVYTKGKENPCSYCHLKTDEVKKIHNINGEVNDVKIVCMRDASHKDCLNCHLDKKSKILDTGPINCTGCHSDLMQSSIKVYEDIPRLDRGQPTAVLLGAQRVNPVKSVNSNSIERVNESYLLSNIGLVPFDHEAHEANNDTCIVCHHSSLNACNECHLNGIKNDVFLGSNSANESKLVTTDKGSKVMLANVMHDKDSFSSCIGCHREESKNKNCVGCHDSLVNQSRQVVSNSYCKNCHSFIINTSLDLINVQKHEDKDRNEDVVKELLKSRMNKNLSYDVNKIPEFVTIDVLEDEYKAVVMPHRKILVSLLERIKTSKLATYFHNEEESLCLGCHHNSLVSEKPPKCASCHDVDLNLEIERNFSTPFKPELVSAYHQQCMWCHNSMDLEKPVSRECSSCHEKKDSR